MKTYKFIMGPRLEMTFMLYYNQNVSVTYPNDDSIITIYNDLDHKEKLLEMQFYDKISFCMKASYPNCIVYTVGECPEKFNAVMKTVSDHFTGININCSDLRWLDICKTIKWLVDTMHPNNRFIFEYTVDNISEKSISDEITKLNDYEYAKFIYGKVVRDQDSGNNSENVAKDPVNHPTHYETGKFECIDVMREVLGDSVVKDFCITNSFKYIYRNKRKNGVEDIKKAKWYIDKYLELEENKND